MGFMCSREDLEEIFGIIKDREDDAWFEEGF